jgi:phenylalanyl-tRNA synthetase beta subunit
MKLIYSHLQKFLPHLKVDPQQLRDDLTMIGHFTNYFEKIDDEIVFDLDIKVNRGDCLGYYGLARDLSVLYHLPLNDLTTTSKANSPSLPTLPITIATDKVKRVMAVKISQIHNHVSPPWLQTFIKLHGTNPVNLAVDLTNYIMFMYGIPNHAFDTRKSGQNLIWEINPKYTEFTSLDGSHLELNSNILMINNPHQALSLSFWGGEACSIDLNTSEIILEMAVYDPATVRQNSRFLKSTTEASIRLEKNLDPDTIPQAFTDLINLILEHCQGQISSQIFDYYTQKNNSKKIEFDLNQPSQIAGINIPPDFTLDTLTRLGCRIQDSPSLSVTPPSIRPDISISADLVEEIIRFFGYQHIPLNQPLTPKQLPDITPTQVYLSEKLKDDLTNLGYDEILTWPLTDTFLDENTVVKTQNSINTEAVYLRQSLIPSLKHQLDQYQRFKLPPTQFFEIGKTFFKKDNHYIEKNTLALYHFNPDQLTTDLKKLHLQPQIIDHNFAEITLDNLETPPQYQPQVNSHPAYELNRQIITLDANINLNSRQNPKKLIEKYVQKIGLENLWQLTITDIYQDKTTQKYRYTFQASYFNLDDKTAKNIHLKAFGLK